MFSTDRPVQELGDLRLLHQIIGLGEYQYVHPRSLGILNMTDTGPLKSMPTSRE